MTVAEHQVSEMPIDLEPGSMIRLRVPKPCFYPEGHPWRTTRHGPLVPREAALTYVGPFLGRPGVYVATTPPQAEGLRMEVLFGLEELVSR
jgi:hypothetical protein